MSLLKFVLSLAIGATTVQVAHALPTADTAATATNSSLPGCGEVNVILTGLPPWHPLVIQQGRDPNSTDVALRKDLAVAVAGGYNVRFSLMGPEKPLSLLEDRLAGIDWTGVGVGMGVRAAENAELTIRFEDILQTYRDVTPDAFMYFNYMPNTTLWAINQRFPLGENCTELGKPGTDLGYEIFCDPDVCSSST